MPRNSREQRDRGLDRISSATAWTAAGALALTGGFAALAAHGFTGNAGATTTPNRSTNGTVAPNPAATAPTSATTAPSTSSGDDGGDDTTPATQTPQTQTPQTQTPQTSPWQAPVQQWQPPVSRSGGS
jgi:hypothetical protein